MGKIIRCPQCGGPSEYSENNKYRPFCSERCKLIDLGDWASENYKVPVQKEEMNEEWSEEDLEQEPH